MRSDWLLPICTGEERLKDDDRRQGASDAEAGGAALSRAARDDEARRRGARPVLRHRHDRRGGEEARPAFHRHRARPGLCGGGARANRRDATGDRRGAEGLRGQAGGAAHSVRLADGSGADRRRRCADRSRAGASRATVRADASLLCETAAGSMSAPSTASARRCRGSKPATAGRSGTPRRTASSQPIDLAPRRSPQALWRREPSDLGTP